MRFLFIALTCLVYVPVFAQPIRTDSLFHLPDSVKPFTIENFYSIIIRHHPVARQSYLLPDLAKQEIRLARGGFDPTIDVSFQSKQYDETDYYKKLEGALKFPTRSPISPQIGIENNEGAYLNPENYIADQYNYNQLFAGISIPLGRGLITDERRTALKQALLFAEKMEAEQISIINKLLLDAAKDYWQWYYYYYQYKLTETNLMLAHEIYRRTLLNYQAGEASAMDTVQSKIGWVERQTIRQESWLELQNQTIKISTYLWDSLLTPLELPANVAPVLSQSAEILDLATLRQLQDQAMQNHPDLIQANIKINLFENERKLAAEYVKPKLNLNYYLLDQPFAPDGSYAFDLDDNYKFGLDFSMPILLRKERSKLAQTKIKIEQANFELDMKERLIMNNITANFNQIIAYRTIVAQQTENVSNYQQLINAEFINLENGESDLFKVNIQLEKLFNNQSKLVKVISNLEKQKAELYWAAGVRPLVSPD